MLFLVAITYLVAGVSCFVAALSLTVRERINSMATVFIVLTGVLLAAFATFIASYVTDMVAGKCTGAYCSLGIMMLVGSVAFTVSMAVIVYYAVKKSRQLQNQLRIKTWPWTVMTVVDLGVVFTLIFDMLRL